jgi:hypothetical protein
MEFDFSRLAISVPASSGRENTSFLVRERWRLKVVVGRGEKAQKAGTRFSAICLGMICFLCWVCRTKGHESVWRFLVDVCRVWSSNWWLVCYVAAFWFCVPGGVVKFTRLYKCLGSFAENRIWCYLELPEFLCCVKF